MFDYYNIKFWSSINWNLDEWKLIANYFVITFAKMIGKALVYGDLWMDTKYVEAARDNLLSI